VERCADKRYLLFVGEVSVAGDKKLGECILDGEDRQRGGTSY
jgi:hypothetical protein